MLWRARSLPDWLINSSRSTTVQQTTLTSPTTVQFIVQIAGQGGPSDLIDMPVPVSEENLKNYGASTTPTLVLIDREGIVRMYHPGSMSTVELETAIRSVL